MNDMSYTNYLLLLLDSKTSGISNELKFNLYLTLLSLNNKNYHEDIYKKEIDTIEDYLRKVNNYKVKIQLKRKEEEINKLCNEIKSIYENNKLLIDKYNKDDLDTINILESKDPKDITNMIDKLTKEKMKKVNVINNNKELCTSIINNIHKYHIQSNNVIIDDNRTVSLDDFYYMFDYLMNIDNYKEVFLKENAINSHKQIITEIIDMISTETITDNNILIPVTLTFLMSNSIPNYNEIATNRFTIDNIKISDLYSFANKETSDNNKAMWQKIIIPNDYLYSKIKDIVLKGMYYFKEDNFVLENIGDFKISISINDMITFIKDNLSLMNTTN